MFLDPYNCDRLEYHPKSSDWFKRARPDWDMDQVPSFDAKCYSVSMSSYRSSDSGADSD